MTSLSRIAQHRKSFTISQQPVIQFSGVNGEITHAGKLSGDGALRVAAAYIANTLIADEVSSLPLKLVERDDKARRPVQPQELRALWGQPNPDQTFMAWMATNSLSLTLHGKSINALGITNAGNLEVMWPVDPLNCSLERIEGGGLRLKSVGQGELVNRPGVQPQFMMVPLFTLPGRIDPISPVAYAAELLGLSAAYQKLATNFAAGGFNPAAIVTLDEPVDPDDAKAMSKALARNHGGANAGKEPAVLGGKGIKIDKLTMSNVDAQFIEQNEKVFDIVMALWRVPPTVAGMVGKPSSWGTGVAEFSRGLERFTLRPIVLRFQAAFEACLLQWVNPDLQARFKFDSMLSASPKDRTEIQRLSLMNGLTSQERVLAQNDEPPFEEDETVYSALSQATDADRRMARLRQQAETARALVSAGVDQASAYAAVGLDVSPAPTPEPRKEEAPPEAKSQPIDLTVNVDLPAVQITNEAAKSQRTTVTKRIDRDGNGDIIAVTEETE